MHDQKKRGTTRTACGNCGVVSEISYTIEWVGTIREPPKTDDECAVCGSSLTVPTGPTGDVL